MPTCRNEAGLTLTEVTVVIILAAVVMTGLVIFYLNAQSMWLDGSAQAITQRELTLTLRAIAKRARTGEFVQYSGDPITDMHVDIFSSNSDPESTFSFWLRDSLIHDGYSSSVDPARQDLGPVMQSRVTVFAVSKDANMLYVDSLGVLTPQGNHITMSTSVALMNKP